MRDYRTDGLTPGSLADLVRQLWLEEHASRIAAPALDSRPRARASTRARFDSCRDCQTPIRPGYARCGPCHLAYRRRLMVA